ncbi:MAG: hypothetical protein JWR80_9655 [Bradyrhizobium sp.]|nr:hypothetical protein [Bradyrhizobium sp.]
MSERSNAFSLFRFGNAVALSLFTLFSSGIVYEAHTRFLQYYIREWEGVQLVGVNGCNGMERVVNGDLIEGQTLCNQPVNFMPWIEIYRRHWQEAALYYGAILVALCLIGVLVLRWQNRRAARSPFGHSAPAPAPEDDEHLL